MLIFTQSKQGEKNPLKSQHVGGQGIVGFCFFKSRCSCQSYFLSFLPWSVLLLSVCSQRQLKRGLY